MPERPDPIGAPQRLVTRPFAMVTGATFVFFLYVGVLVPLIPRLVEERLGGNELDIGLNLAMFSAAAVLLAVGMSFQYPALMAMALNDAPEVERTRVLASFTMFFDVGTILGALVLGGAAQLSSKRGGFFGGAVMCAVGLALLWRWLLPWSRRTAVVHSPAVHVARELDVV